MAATPDLKQAETVDPLLLIKQLAPDQIGLFEPLSGLMLINISDAELIELTKRWTAQQCDDSDIAILHAINHEAYHFAQVAASGYVFQRASRSFTILNASKPTLDPPKHRILRAIARLVLGKDTEYRRRFERVLALVDGNQQLAKLEARAAEGDNSLAGALIPGLFKHIREVAEYERVPNASGLSIMGVLEGSAVVHANMLMHPNEDARPYVESELATLPRVYGELYSFTKAQAGARVLEVILPTVALALRYTQPHNAFGRLLVLLAESSPGKALDYGRAVGKKLPAIAEAGPLLGTAIDLWRKQKKRYRFYDSILDKLETEHWGIDSYAFLAEPAAMHKVGSFPLGIVTTDGYHGGIDRVELVARMAVMSVVLRVGSRRRLEREFRNFQLDWARGVIGRVFEGTPASGVPTGTDKGSASDT